MRSDAIVGAAIDFPNCIARLWPRVAEAGVTQAVFDEATVGLTPDLRLLDMLDAQPEFSQPIEKYLNGLLTQDRIDRGRTLLEQYRRTFDEIERRFGVDRHVLAAIWGIETNYGRAQGQWPVLRSVATLACIGRRQEYFRNEFVSVLTILERQEINSDQLKGSWTGAFGQIQMMPSVFKTFAVDFDRDGRRDIIESIPDLLASAAQYLKLHGWSAGRRWGLEVRLPPDFDRWRAPQSQSMALSNWATLGVGAAGGEPLAEADLPASLLLPAGPRGPAFLVSDNYGVILSYNPADSYALAVALLSDRLREPGSAQQASPRGRSDPN